MANDSAVDRSTVLGVLKYHGVDVAENKGVDSSFVLVRDGAVLEVTLREEVPGTMLYLIERRLGIYRHYFYNPFLSPPSGPSSIQ